MNTLNGIGVFSGIALGKALKYTPSKHEIEERHFPSGEEEKYIAIWDHAKSTASEELTAIIQRMAIENPLQAKIFTAHAEILEDEDIDEEVRLLIEDEQAMPDWAVKSVFDEFRGIFRASANKLINERVADLEDVCGRLLRILGGESPGADLSALKEAVVIVAEDLLPSDTAMLDRERVLGIVTENGGPTCHTAIIAKSYGIPAVLGTRDILSQVSDGDMLIVDGEAGEVIVSPDEEATGCFLEKKARLTREADEAESYRTKPCILPDGEHVHIGLNIANDRDTDGFDSCDFVGLFRTEFLYMDSDHLPTEEEQYQAYRTILKRAGDKPVTLRTLDIGGDKTLPYMSLPSEENPFLGKRAVRLCFNDPELFHTQLRAALRASIEGNLQIMFPMIGSIEDIRRAQSFVAQAKAQLDAKGIAYNKNTRIGIMIEVPSIAMVAEQAAEEVDFASIGTNDLCQYVCAADRMEPEVAEYYRSYSPGFLRVVAHIIKSFNEAGKEVSICGELAGDRRAAELLIGMGLRKFSMSPSMVGGVKKVIANVRTERAKHLKDQVLSAKTQQEVYDLIGHA